MGKTLEVVDDNLRASTKSALAWVALMAVLIMHWRDGQLSEAEKLLAKTREPS